MPICELCEEPYTQSAGQRSKRCKLGRDNVAKEKARKADRAYYYRKVGKKEPVEMPKRNNASVCKHCGRTWYIPSGQTECGVVCV